MDLSSSAQDFEDLTTLPAIERATRVLDDALRSPSLPAGWVERCYACLLVPVPPDVWGIAPTRPYAALYWGALRILKRLAPPGIGARLLPLIRVRGPGVCIQAAIQGTEREGSSIAWPERGSGIVPAAEIGPFLDWCETLSAREAGPNLGSHLRGMIVANGDASTLADLKRRLADHDLIQPKRTLYEVARKDLRTALDREKRARAAATPTSPVARQPAKPSPSKPSRSKTTKKTTSKKATPAARRSLRSTRAED
jgi:hypothetical protein